MFYRVDVGRYIGFNGMVWYGGIQDRVFYMADVG